MSFASINSKQKTLGIERFYKVMGDRVYDTVLQTEIANSEALRRLAVLERGTITESNDPRGMRQYYQNPLEAPQLVTSKFQRDNHEVYGHNWLNVPQGQGTPGS